MYTYKINEALLEYRLQEKLSRKEMAEKLSMSEDLYVRYESEEPPVPDVDTICLMSEVTGRFVDYLLQGKKAAGDRALQRLPKDFQMLCEIYGSMKNLDIKQLQRIDRFLDFMEKEKNKSEEKTDGNV